MWQIYLHMGVMKKEWRQKDTKNKHYALLQLANSNV